MRLLSTHADRAPRSPETPTGHGRWLPNTPGEPRTWGLYGLGLNGVHEATKSLRFPLQYVSAHDRVQDNGRYCTRLQGSPKRNPHRSCLQRHAKATAQLLQPCEAPLRSIGSPCGIDASGAVRRIGLFTCARSRVSKRLLQALCGPGDCASLVCCRRPHYVATVLSDVHRGQRLARERPSPGVRRPT